VIRTFSISLRGEESFGEHVNQLRQEILSTFLIWMESGCLINRDRNSSKITGALDVFAHLVNEKNQILGLTKERAIYVQLEFTLNKKDSWF